MKGRTDQSPRKDSGALRTPRTGARRDLIWGAGIFLVFVLFSAGMLLIFNPAKAQPHRSAQAPKGKDILALTLVHSNDTWGYLAPCG